MSLEACNPGDGARAIQLALTPVFLLSGIAGMLYVMTSRLGRIIDRSRLLREALPDTSARLLQRADELRVLQQRGYLAGTAITMCTLAAVLTCLVIVLLFAEALSGLPLKWLEGGLFAGMTAALVVGLTYFLREVRLATRTTRFDAESDNPT